MKKILASVLVVLLIASIFVIDSQDLLTNKVYADETEESNDNIVEVYGTATIEVDPDVAYINIGVETESKDSSEAQQENSTKMNKIIESIQALDVSEDQIKTLNYRIYPRYNYLENNEKEKYYVVSNTLKVTVNNLDQVGDIIDAASMAGANKINSIQFSVKDDTAIYNEALSSAVKAAEAKATSIMSVFDKKPGIPKKVLEISNNAGVYRDSAVNYSMEATKAVSSTPIESGSLSVKAKVKVIYEY